jgi:Protein of unknown function, DUF258.
LIGPFGVGKSTLINRLIGAYRKKIIKLESSL